MNSNDEDFDWHKRGVWLAHSPNGAKLFGGFGPTPHNARAELLRCLGRRWDELAREGFTIQEYELAIPVLTDIIKVGDQVAVAAEARWYYPANGEAAPAGVTVQLLTRGGITVRGVWNDLGDFIAWAPMIKRDKELEERLGL